MAVFSVSRVESQIVSRFIFGLVRVNSWIVSAQRNTIHETTRNNTKRYEITPNDEAIVDIPNLDSKLGHYSPTGSANGFYQRPPKIRTSENVRSTPGRRQRAGQCL